MRLAFWRAGKDKPVVQRAVARPAPSAAKPVAASESGDLDLHALGQALMRKRRWIIVPTLLALVAGGATRDDAYRIVQRDAMKAWEERTDFRTLLEKDPEIRLSKETLDEAFDLDRSLRHLDRVAAALDELVTSSG